MAITSVKVIFVEEPSPPWFAMSRQKRVAEKPRGDNGKDVENRADR
jgi:hypothetical protein